MDHPFVKKSQLHQQNYLLPSHVHQISKWRMTSVNISMVQLTCSVIYLQVFEFKKGYYFSQIRQDL